MTEKPQDQTTSNTHTHSETAQFRAIAKEYSLEDPQATLDHIRSKMERVAHEFREGRLNRAQFNAIYGHHSEQRAIIEKLLKRDPTNDAWRQVARPGHTTFLRDHFEAKSTFYVVFKHKHQRPLTSGGEHPPKAIAHIVTALKHIWKLDKIPANRLARKEIEDEQWLVLAIGENATTCVIFSAQPSSAQVHLVRDLHDDFESANRRSIKRNLPASQLVYPQRALLKKA